MCLTEKDKRVIQTPLSFSVLQRKDARYRARIKIQRLLQDVEFVMMHQKAICDEFGINVAEDVKIPRHDIIAPKELITSYQKNTQGIKDSSESQEDPDLL